MASSAQFIPYVVDTYHDPGYVGGEHRLVVELTAQDASASGVGEVTSVAIANVQAQDATTSATTKRTVFVLNADLHDGPATIVDVAGDGERSIVTVVSAAEVDTPSQVTGVAERIISASGALSIGESSVSGAGVRASNNILSSVQAQSSSIAATANIGRVTSPSLETGASDVIGVSEREITGGNTLTAQDASVSGISEAERQSTGTPKAQDVAVDGLAERVIVNVDATPKAQASDIAVTANIGRLTSAALKPTENNEVGGVAENIITGTGALQQSSVPVVSGIAERVITASGALADNGQVAFGVSTRTVVDTDATPQAQSSSVSGVTDRKIVDVDATPQAQSSSTVSAAERIIVQEGNAQFKPTDNNVVTGQGVARKIASGALVATPDSVVTGVAERIIDDQGGLTAEAGSSTVTTVIERIIPAEAVAIQMSDADVIGVAERVIENNAITQAIKPTDNNNVSGAAERVITGSGDLQDSPVSLTDVAGDGERSINTTLAALVHDDDAEVVATINVTRVTSVALQASDAVITETNEITSNSLDGTLDAQDVTVAGVAERKVTAGSSVLQVSEVITGAVAGVGEREIRSAVSLSAQDVTVSGVAENTIPASGSLATSDVTVAGIAERIIPAESIALQPTTNNTVTGVAENKITGDGALGAVGWGVGGSATRIITLDDGTIEAQSSTVTAVAERTITGSGDLQDSPVSLTDVAGDGERSINSVVSALVVDDPSDTVGAAERIITGSGEYINYTVGRSGNGAYVINGVQNPTLEFHKGSKYIFNIATPGHPFWIKTVAGTLFPVGTGTENAYNDGVTNNGEDNGVLMFVVPDDAPDTLYYACQYHSSMGGTIDVQKVLSPVAQESTTTGVAERTVVNVDATPQAQSATVDASTTVILKPKGILELSDSLVTGESLRTIVDVTPNPSAQSSTVAGVAERTVELEVDGQIDGDVSAGPSTVAGVAEVTKTFGSAILTTQDVSVVGSGFRTSKSIGNQNVDPVPCEVLGFAERVIVSVEADLTASEVGVSIVAGVGEREIDDQGGDALTTVDCVVTGVAERIIKVADGVPDSNGVAIPRSGPSTVTAVTKRTVISIEADLTADEVGTSNVSGTSGRREVSAAVPLVRSFRITKPKQVTIVIRTKPSAIEAV